MTKPVIPYDQIQNGSLLKHTRFGEVEVIEPPKTARSLVRIEKIKNGATTYVKRQELSWL